MNDEVNRTDVSVTEKTGAENLKVLENIEVELTV